MYVQSGSRAAGIARAVEELLEARHERLLLRIREELADSREGQVFGQLLQVDPKQ